MSISTVAKAGGLIAIGLVAGIFLSSYLGIDWYYSDELECRVSFAGNLDIHSARSVHQYCERYK